MLDALLPAVAALGQADDDDDVASAMARAATAARQGMEATASMLAGAGRSRSLGERVLGHVDPGAMSMSLVLDGFAQALERPKQDDNSTTKTNGEKR